MSKILSLTLNDVRELSPCEESYRRVSRILPENKKITAAQAVKAGCTLDDLVWVASAIARNNKAVDRLLRHWMADCAARVLHIYEREYPNDLRVRNAIIAARQYADGQIDDAARADARAAAWDARAAAWDAWAAAWDAWAAARADARDAAWAAWAAEEKWQLNRLVYWFTKANPRPLEI